MDKIQNIISRQIFDSRGNPTIETDVFTNNGVIGRAAVPSGASTGAHEAYELRDKGNKYHGKSVIKAVSNVNGEIFDSITGLDVSNQIKIDETLLKLDGKKNKSRIGANSILSVSLACAVAASNAQKIPLFKYLGGTKKFKMPTPMLNIINGGAHANNNLSFQEFMIVPVNNSTFSEAIRKSSEVFHNLKIILDKKKFSTSVGDEGGFSPNLKSEEDALKLISEAINKSGYKLKKDFCIALDIAASEFYKNGKYKLISENKPFSTDQFIKYLSKLINRYPIVSLEDPFEEDDWSSWSKLTHLLGDKVQIVGDDLFTTNLERLKKGISKKAANAILIKLNQIGTVSETLEVIKFAQLIGFNTIISHRSGESEDTFISDLAVGTNSNQIKAGSLARSERVAKYNQLIRIEEKLGKSAKMNKIN